MSEDHQDQQDKMENRVPQVQVVPLGPLVLLVLKEKVVLLALLEKGAIKETEVMLVLLAVLVKMVKLDLRVLQDRLGRGEKQEMLE